MSVGVRFAEEPERDVGLVARGGRAGRCSRRDQSESRVRLAQGDEPAHEKTAMRLRRSASRTIPSGRCSVAPDARGRARGCRRSIVSARSDGRRSRLVQRRGPPAFAAASCAPSAASSDRKRRLAVEGSTFSEAGGGAERSRAPEREEESGGSSQFRVTFRDAARPRDGEEEVAERGASRGGATRRRRLPRSGAHGRLKGSANSHGTQGGEHHADPSQTTRPRSPPPPSSSPMPVESYETVEARVRRPRRRAEGRGDHRDAMSIATPRTRTIVSVYIAGKERREARRVPFERRTWRRRCATQA